MGYRRSCAPPAPPPGPPFPLGPSVTQPTLAVPVPRRSGPLLSAVYCSFPRTINFAPNADSASFISCFTCSKRPNCRHSDNACGGWSRRDVERFCERVGTAATFTGPEGVAVDRTGSFALFTDDGNNLIRYYTISTGAVTTLAGKAGVAGTADGTGSAATFSWPHYVTLDLAGSIALVTDFNSHLLRRIVVRPVLLQQLQGLQAFQDMQMVWVRR